MLRLVDNECRENDDILYLQRNVTRLSAGRMPLRYYERAHLPIFRRRTRPYDLDIQSNPNTLLIGKTAYPQSQNSTRTTKLDYTDLQNGDSGVSGGRT